MAVVFLSRAARCLFASLPLLLVATPAAAAPSISFYKPPATVRAEDCATDATMRLTIELSQYDPGADVEVWTGPVGVDCGVFQARSGSTPTCTRLLSGLQLVDTDIVDVPVRSLGLCADAGATAVSVQALYFEPGNLTTANASARISIALGDGSPASPDDDGCTASPRPLDSSATFGFAAVGLWAFRRRQRSRARARR